jgi:DNA helicase-2/ATP-dependent DNA helicase PcrA
MSLNSQQLKAINTIEGPVLVVAGPGTGKTKILTERIAKILELTDANPENILCITYTETGASNMKKRLVDQIGPTGYKVRIATFHAFCNEIINERSDIFQKQKQLIQIDALTQKRILDKILHEFPLDTFSHAHLFRNNQKTFYAEPLARLIENLKKDGIIPTEAIAKMQTIIANAVQNPTLAKSGKNAGKPSAEYIKNLEKLEKFLEALTIYKLYDEALTLAGYYDYNDMILWVIDAFEKNENLLRDYQERYQYILVDEYQDTSGSQNKLLFLLGKDHPENKPNIFVVGDDDQSIFKFQGANVTNLLDFKNTFDAEVITVDINYRSTQRILDIAGSLIDNNNERLTKQIPNLEKKLKSGREVADQMAYVVELLDDESEILFVTEKIKELIQKGVDASKIAVLYRNHSHADKLIEFLLKNKIPINLQRGRNALDEPLINGFINLLRVVNAKFSPDYDAIFFKAISQPYFEINPIELYKLSIDLYKNKFQNKLEKVTTVYEKIIESIDLTLDFDIDKLSKIQKAVFQISQWKSLSQIYPAFLTIQTIAEESGFLKYIFGKNNSVSLEDLSSIQSIFDFVRDRNDINKTLNLAELLDDIDEMLEAGISIEERNLNTAKKGVNLMTVHSSKGLEFEIVFMIRTTEDVWKEKRNSTKISIPDEFLEFQKTADNLEELRRLFFVGITRAEQGIFFTSAKIYREGNTEKSTAPAPFLYEIDRTLIKQINVEELPTTTKDTVMLNLLPVKQIKVSDNEMLYLKSLIEGYRLSASDLKAYLKCPLEFKMTRLYKIPVGNYKGSLHMTLGLAIHAGLESSFKNHGDKLYLANTAFENYLKKQLLLKDDFEQLRNNGYEIITKFFESGENFHTTHIVEKFFGYETTQIIKTKNFDDIMIIGKIDRIDIVDASGPIALVKVVDYKTGSDKSLNHILAQTAEKDRSYIQQMVFYKLLCETSPIFYINNKKVKVQEAEFMFLKDGVKKVSFQFDDEMIQSVLDDIDSCISGIRSLDFHGSEQHPLCGECEWCSNNFNQ